MTSAPKPSSSSTGTTSATTGPAPSSESTSSPAVSPDNPDLAFLFSWIEENVLPHVCTECWSNIDVEETDEGMVVTVECKPSCTCYCECDQDSCPCE